VQARNGDDRGARSAATGAPTRRDCRKSLLPFVDSDAPDKVAVPVVTLDAAMIEQSGVTSQWARDLR